MDASTVTVITDLISNVGFPIVVCFVMFWYINKTNDANKEELNLLKSSIDENTRICTKLYEKISDTNE